MKQKDLGILAAVLVFSVIASFLVSSYAFGALTSREEQVAKVDKISGDFPIDQIHPQYFNNNSVDPLQLIHIGQPNQNPFSGNSGD
jgi:hypothetical protein